MSPHEELDALLRQRQLEIEAALADRDQLTLPMRLALNQAGALARQAAAELSELAARVALERLQAQREAPP